MLAFGQSFGNPGLGFFTPTNIQYAQMFFLALMKYGLENLWVQAEISAYRERFSGDVGASKLEQIEISADEIRCIRPLHGLDTHSFFHEK